MAIQYTKELMQEAVDRSTSWSSLIRNLGLTVAGGNFRQTKRRVSEYGIDTSHFTGQGWSKGKSENNDSRVASVTRKITKWTDEQLLIKGGPATNGKRLTKAMLKKGRKHECLLCRLDPTNWNDAPLTLQVDHVNGDNSDNRLDNLRFLCPNCHSQQATSHHNVGVQKVIAYVESQGFKFCDMKGFNIIFESSTGNRRIHKYVPGKQISEKFFDTMITIDNTTIIAKTSDALNADEFDEFLEFNS